MKGFAPSSVIALVIGGRADGQRRQVDVPPV